MLYVGLNNRIIGYNLALVKNLLVKHTHKKIQRRKSGRERRQRKKKRQGEQEKEKKGETEIYKDANIQKWNTGAGKEKMQKDNPGKGFTSHRTVTWYKLEFPLCVPSYLS